MKWIGSKLLPQSQRRLRSMKSLLPSHSVGRLGFACFFLLSLCLLTGQSNAAPLDLTRLRDAICAHETRGKADPDAEVGKASEFGRCQVKIETARQLGYKGHPAMLFIRDVNEEWAMRKLVWCRTPSYNERGQQTHSGYQTVAGLAWCYNGGKWRGKLNKEDEYVRAVLALYTAKQITAR